MLVAASWRHAGYIMILYLAGLKASTRRCARRRPSTAPTVADVLPRRLPGACGRSTSWSWSITVIESLRAFDLVYIINSGRNGLELLSVLVTQNIVGEASRIGFGSALGGDPAGHLARLHHHLPGPALPGGAAMSAVATAPDRCRGRTASPGGDAGRAGAGSLLHVFLIVIGARLAVPAALRGLHVAAAVRGDRRARLRLAAARPHASTTTPGAWTQAELPHYFLNTLIITVPAVVLTLFLASIVAFVLSRLQLAASTWRC